MFELRACDDWTIVDRGQRRADDEGERKPGRYSGYPLNHRR
jgi:hypothetical protein